VTRSKDVSHIAYLSQTGDLIECWQSKGNRFGKWEISSFNKHKTGTPYKIWSVEMSDEDADYIDEYFYGLADRGVKYNWWGISAFILKFTKGSSERLFCSEGFITPFVHRFRWTEVIPSHVDPKMCNCILQAAGGKLLAKGTT
jgi:hypothetical protein